MSGKGSYIWDEWSDDEQEQKKDQKDSPLFGGFEIGFSDNRSVSSLGSPSRGGGSTLESVTSEIASKVDKMKKELQTKQQETKQLQQEFARIHAAKERRIDKCRVTQEGRLTTVREQNAAAVHKLDELHTRLQADVHKLSGQVQGLEERMSLSKAHQMEAIEKTKRDAQKRLQRAKRQWEADEAVRFEKVIKSKSEYLQKQAADSFGPKIDKLVKEGKEKVAQIRDDGEVKLQKLQLSLQADHEKKIAECKDRLTEQITSEIDKVKRTLQRQQEDLVKAHQIEVTTVQEKYKREKVILDEGHERTQRMESEQAQDALQSISKRETQQIQELLDKQQREISYLSESHAAAVLKLKTSLQAQAEQTLHKATQLTQALQAQRLERRKVAVQRKFATETQQILQKLREDAQIERARIQEGYEKKVEDVRIKVQQQLETKDEQQQREASRLASLNAEISTFQAQLLRLQQTENTAKNNLNERLNPTLVQLRAELRAVEDEFQQLAPRQADELHTRRAEL
eukprot:gene15278-17485_t